MTEQQVQAYVRATAQMLALPLDEGRVLAVALHLGRTAALARLLEDAPLAAHDEPDEIYRAAPFPVEDAA